MRNVVSLSAFKKVHIPYGMVRAEVNNDSVLLSFPRTERPDMTVAKDSLPSWFLAKIVYVEERVSFGEACEHGSRMGDNVFYINCEA